MGALETLRRREWTIAWVRWSTAALAAGQLVLGGRGGLPLTLTLVATLAALGFVVSAAESRLETATAWRQLSALLMLADSVAIVGLVYAGLREGLDELWTLMVLLAVMGALRYRLRGALLASIGAGLAYAGLEVAVGTGVDAGILLGRLLFLAVVGGFVGALSRELDVERVLYQRVAAASQDIVVRRDVDSILTALATHVNTALDGRRAAVYRYSLTAWEEVVQHRASGVPGGDAPLLRDGEDGVSAMLHRLTWRPRTATAPARLTLPVRLPERPAEYLVAVELSGQRPSALAEGALMALAESTAVSLATRDLIRSQEASNRRLERLEALRTRFVATVAHDLRSPLTTVKGVASILRGRRDTVPPEQVDAMLASVERQANRLNRLADDLLDAARLDSDALELKREQVGLGVILEAVREDAADDVEVVDVGDLTLVADGARLERIVWNLVSNALKYGRPPVRLDAWQDASATHVRVRDHGAGLSRAQVASMFEDFSGSDHPDSVGLGLAIVWELAAAHGGTVEYRNADPGAEFVVSIPTADAEVADSRQ